MERQLVLYLDNCVFSRMLEPESIGFRKAVASLPHRVAFSNVHIIEMMNNSDKYTELLEELNAIFVRNPGDEHNRYHPISSLDLGDPYQRFADHVEIAPAYDAFEAMLSPMQHFLGGQRELEMAQIADTTGARIKSSLGKLFISIDSEFLDVSATLLHPQIDDTTKIISGLNVEDSWKKMDAQVKAARDGDPMRNMGSAEKIEHLISSLDSADKDAFIAKFPRNFAQQRILENAELTSFAFTLFTLGLTKRKGVFSGPNQERKFAAQFRDAMHIEEASRCDCFITMDKGAFELAAATFVYAGFTTQAILLQTPTLRM